MLVAERHVRRETGDIDDRGDGRLLRRRAVVDDRRRIFLESAAHFHGAEDARDELDRGVLRVDRVRLGEQSRRRLRDGTRRRDAGYGKREREGERGALARTHECSVLSGWAESRSTVRTYCQLREAEDVREVLAQCKLRPLAR